MALQQNSNDVLIRLFDVLSDSLEIFERDVLSKELNKVIEIKKTQEVRLGNLSIECYLGSSVFVLDKVKDSMPEDCFLLLYLDPPYNTKANTEYIDEYEINVWLSLFSNVLEKLNDICSSRKCVLFISISDRMSEYIKGVIRKAMPSMFYVTTIVWHKGPVGQNMIKRFSVNHEYIFLFTNDVSWEPLGWERSEKERGKYKNWDNDLRGPWKAQDLTAPATFINDLLGHNYPIVLDGQVFYPPKGRLWRYKKEKVEELKKQNRIFCKPGRKSVYLKVFLTEIDEYTSPPTVWDYKSVGNPVLAKRKIKHFSTPKPIQLIKKIIEISCHAHKKICIIDPFAGGGTTGYAAFDYAKENIDKKIEVKLIDIMPIHLDEKYLEPNLFT